MRIASNTITENLVRQIQQLGTSQAKLQAQVAGGQRLTQAEDDPAAMGRVLNLGSEQRATAQYARNANRALELSQASTSGLQQIKKLSDRATEIGVLGAGTAAPEAMQAYAAELNQLIEQAVQLGNSRFGNDYLYAGTAVDTAPFAAGRDAEGRVTSVTYAGNATQSPIALSDTASVSAGTSGTTNQGLADFLNHLVALRDALTARDAAAVTAAETGLIATEDVLVSSLAEQGAIQMRIEVNQAQQQDRLTDLERLVSSEVDADLPTTIVHLNQTATAYQAALQSSASIMRISLLDYIK
jgi:flagellar hook-associated protein 3 FlgL